MLILSLNRGARGALIGLTAGVLATGCVAVGPNFRSPPAPAAAGYAMTGDDVDPAGSAAIGDKVVADWWTLFRSPALDQLMRQAIADNRTLEAARARLSQARAATAGEGGRLTADASGGFKREQANLNAFSGGAFSGLPSLPGFSFPTNPEFNLYSIGTSVSYDLDLFGGARRRRESLAADAEAKARELDAAYLTLTGHVVQQALIIADASIQADALQDIVEHDQTALAMVQQSRAAGGSSAVDVVDAQAQLAQDAAALPAQHQRLAAARHALAVLVGKAPSEWSPPAFNAESGVLPAVLPVSVPSALVHGRPDILEAEARLHAATAQIGVAEAARYPKITLNGGYNLDSLTTHDLFAPTSASWAIGPALSVPLFHSGELKARQRAAEAAARAALADYQQTVLEAFAQVADVLQSIAHDNQVYAEQTRALSAAAQRLDAVRNSYRLGGVSALQVVNAERTWRRARLGVSQTASSRHSDAAMLLLAVATVPPGLSAEPPPK